VPTGRPDAPPRADSEPSWPILNEASSWNSSASTNSVLPDTASSSGWLPTPTRVEPSSVGVPSAAIENDEIEPLPAFAVKAKRPSFETTSQQAAPWWVSTGPAIVENDPSEPIA
jgi:hypothetical protein